jgi:hypothetical protein
MSTIRGEPYQSRDIALHHLTASREIILLTHLLQASLVMRGNPLRRAAIAHPQRFVTYDHDRHPVECRHQVAGSRISRTLLIY